jgi:hypothetical protein
MDLLDLFRKIQIRRQSRRLCGTHPSGPRPRRSGNAYAYQGWKAEPPPAFSVSGRSREAPKEAPAHSLPESISRVKAIVSLPQRRPRFKLSIHVSLDTLYPTSHTALDHPFRPFFHHKMSDAILFPFRLPSLSEHETLPNFVSRNPPNDASKPDKHLPCDPKKPPALGLSFIICGIFNLTKRDIVSSRYRSLSLFNACVVLCIFQF